MEEKRRKRRSKEEGIRRERGRTGKIVKEGVGKGGGRKKEGGVKGMARGGKEKGKGRKEEKGGRMKKEVK